MLKQFCTPIVKQNVMRKFIPVFLLLTFSALTTIAQNIKGTVKDADGKNIVNASVSLMNAKDSSVVKLAVTNDNGEYNFKDIKSGHYITSVSYVGYTTTYSPAFEVPGNGDVSVTSVTLSKLSADLK